MGAKSKIKEAGLSAIVLEYEKNGFSHAAIASKLADLHGLKTGASNVQRFLINHKDAARRGLMKVQTDKPPPPPAPLPAVPVVISDNPHENIKKAFEIFARVLYKNAVAYENKLCNLPAKDIQAVLKLQEAVLKTEILEAQKRIAQISDFSAMSIQELDKEIQRLEGNVDPPKLDKSDLPALLAARETKDKQTEKTTIKIIYEDYENKTRT